MVRVTRRENLKGAIELTVRNLPAGVTAAAAVLPPDDDKAILTLTANRAVTLDSRVVYVEGRYRDGEKAIVRRATPLEIYRVNNNEKRQERLAQVVGITTDPVPFTLETTSIVTMIPGQETKITVKINRQPDFKGEVVLAFAAFPPGCTGQNQVRVPGNQSEATISLRASNDAAFLIRPRPAPDLPPMQTVIVGAVGGNIENANVCTLPIKVVPSPTVANQ